MPDDLAGWKTKFGEGYRSAGDCAVASRSDNGHEFVARVCGIGLPGNRVWYKDRAVN